MENLLELREVSKIYPGVVALDKVNLQIRPGEVHSLMGENGAGKSTMIKVIAGVIVPEEGSILIDGKEYKNLTPAKSRELGIGVIYQELNMVGSLSVAENVFLGSKIGGKYVIDFKEMHRRTRELLDEFNLNMDTHQMVEQLSTAQQQMVEIIKAISRDVRVLIMDEPSAAITAADVEKLFEIIQKLKSRGVAIIYVSHRMEEVFRISDRVTVLRDGQYVATKSVKEVSRQDLISMMVGRELKESFPVRNSVIGEVLLETKQLTGNGDYDVSFQLHKGEILGIAGLIGAGRTELAEMLFGAAEVEGGEILLRGKPICFKQTSESIAAGIGLIPEDRRRRGLFLNYTISWNAQIMALKRLANRLGVIDVKTADKETAEYEKILRIKTPSLNQEVKKLSGGNQQKVVLAKVLASKAEILIFDEPTRGIDIGAKQEIYQLMNELIEKGMSIIMISSEMEELMGMSDRIIVMREGMISSILNKEEFSQKRIMELAAN